MTQARASAFGELDIWLARAGRHEQLYAKLGAHVVDGGVRFAVWAPNAQYVSVIGDFNDWDSAAHVLEPVAETRHLGRASSKAPAPASTTSSTSTAARRPTRWRSRRSCRRRPRRSSSSRATSGTTTPGWSERRTAGAARAADERLRGARAVVAQGARLAAARGRARAVRAGSRLHARRAAAGDAPPVFGLVGLPGDGLLRAGLDDGLARRLPVLRRPHARERDRRAARLGAGAFRDRPVGADAVRRHGALRARRSSPRRASRLGHVRLQPRPQRGAELPARERALLAARVPRRRHPRRRRRVDALPRLLAQGRRVGAERVRRPRGSRRRRVPQGAERARARARAGRDLGSRGVDRVAGRLAADLRRRARLRLQVEHGVDARHAELLPARSRSTAGTTITS